jgi:hypothetical protein
MGDFGSPGPHHGKRIGAAEPLRRMLRILLDA